MFTYIKNDITNVAHGIVAHGCNCSGGFGSGVAGAIRKKWPMVYDRFKEVGANKDLLGTIDIIEVTPNLYVVNMYTQESYGYDNNRYADPVAIEKCLRAVLNFGSSLNHHTIYAEYSVYIPKIGCGLGGLDWELDVEPIVNNLAKEYLSNIYVCEL